jgi:hypothetical protein
MIWTSYPLSSGVDDVNAPRIDRAPGVDDLQVALGADKIGFGDAWVQPAGCPKRGLPRTRPHRPRPEDGSGRGGNEHAGPPAAPIQIRSTLHP